MQRSRLHTSVLVSRSTQPSFLREGSQPSAEQKRSTRCARPCDLMGLLLVQKADAWCSLVTGLSCVGSVPCARTGALVLPHLPAANLPARQTHQRIGEPLRA